MRHLVLATVLLAATAAAAERPAPTVDFDRTAPPDTVGDYDGFQARIFREGRLFIAGQPSEAAVRELPTRGVTAVVNLRTPREMENRERVPFDEQALLAELGIEYAWIPLGGDDFPYTIAAVDTFAAVLDRHRGPVLLHCTVAWRASHLWAAYLVRHQGWQLADAWARGAAIGIGELPLASLLDTELTVTEVD